MKGIDGVRNQSDLIKLEIKINRKQYKMFNLKMTESGLITFAVVSNRKYNLRRQHIIKVHLLTHKLLVQRIFWHSTRSIL